MCVNVIACLSLRFDYARVHCDHKCERQAAKKNNNVHRPTYLHGEFISGKNRINYKSVLQ